MTEIQIYKIPQEKKDLKVHKCVTPVRLAEPLLLSHRNPQHCRWKFPEKSTVEQADLLVGRLKEVSRRYTARLIKIRHFLQASSDVKLRAWCIHFAFIHCYGAFDFYNVALLKKVQFHILKNQCRLKPTFQCGYPQLHAQSLKHMDELY